MIKDFEEFLIEGKVNESYKPEDMVQLISENAQAYHDDDDKTHERKGYLTEIREGCDKLLQEGGPGSGKSAATMLAPGEEGECEPPKGGKPGTCTFG